MNSITALSLLRDTGTASSVLVYSATRVFVCIGCRLGGAIQLCSFHSQSVSQSGCHSASFGGAPWGDTIYTIRDTIRY